MRMMKINMTSKTKPNFANLESAFIPAETDFYGHHEWAMNIFPTVLEVISHLKAAIARLDACNDGWQFDETRTNIFLLACAISDSADDCLSGSRHDLSAFKRKLRPLRPILGLAENLLNARARRRERHLDGLRSWRREWENAVVSLLKAGISNSNLDWSAYKLQAVKLVSLLDFPLPPALCSRRIKSPRAFRTQDFTFNDIVLLANKFVSASANRAAPYLILGLRTAGSYFAPLFRAVMELHGFANVATLTLRPKGGLNATESALLRQYAAQGGTAVIVDEPVYQGVTLAICMRLLGDAGFRPSSVAAVFPLHPAALNWQSTNAVYALNGCQVVTMPPEATQRYQLLQATAVGRTLEPYFIQRGWHTLAIIEDENVRAFNEKLDTTSEDLFHTRLKRVFGVRLTRADGHSEVRYIIGKSVGCGWCGYQAYFAAQRLAGRVPPALGLRDGILYSEWVQADESSVANADRLRLSNAMSDYVAHRAQVLRYPEDLAPSLARSGSQFGLDILSDTLTNTYRSGLLRSLNRRRIKKHLVQMTSRVACLTDAKMRAPEWIRSGEGYLKADYEQHGMGRMELSIIDPAYDLADASLALALSAAEDKAFVDRYIAQTGDDDVRERLPFCNILAGQWEMGAALYCLNRQRPVHQLQDAHAAYIRAWTFSMVQMARYCAQFIPPHAPALAERPLVFLDVDGVIDQHLFSFPTTTQSGIRALSLLLTARFPVYLNTARSVFDVQAYCEAYGLPGAVAESGSYFWDAAGGRGHALVSDEALGELERVRSALRKIPGVYLNDHYQYSIKAFTYNETRTAPVPTVLLNQVLAEVEASKLMLHQTYFDSAITSASVNKGSAIPAMRTLTGQQAARVIAVGDTEPDLAMFQVADRSYAPAHTQVRELAALLGCKIAAGVFQNGFLEIAEDILRSENIEPSTLQKPVFEIPIRNRLLLDLLGEADLSDRQKLKRTVFDVKRLKEVFS